jgi:pyridoxamine 5'-phosphate oxidase
MNAQLQYIFDDSWNKLATAGSKDAVFKNITLCNYAADDINAYTVVLRGADASAGNIIIYTDYRSPKVDQLRHNSKVTIVAYSDGEKLQLILKGEAIVHYQDDVSERYWKESGYKGRRSYLAQPAPSTVVDEATDGLAYLNQKEFEEQDPAGYENFAVISIKADFMEYLQLNREGNRRAKFVLSGSNEWEGMWLIP